MWETHVPFEHVLPRADKSPGPGPACGPSPDLNVGPALNVTSEVVLGFKVFLNPSRVVHLKTEPNGPFISQFCEKSRSGAKTVKETREPIFMSDVSQW